MVLEQAPDSKGSAGRPELKDSSGIASQKRQVRLGLSRCLTFVAVSSCRKSSCPDFHQKSYRVDLPSHRVKSKRQRYLNGWRAGATASCITALVVFMVNFIVLVWATSRYHFAEGIGILFSGNCARAKSTNTWLQFIVNVLSSILLAASNYCMQCLSSPTRKEVDSAHIKGRMLDIGIPSVQNLRAISMERKLLWTGIVISALPLHFMYVSQMLI